MKPPSPPPYNFISLPSVDSRHPLWAQPDLAERLARGEGGNAGIAHGRRETWGSDLLTGEARETMHLPGNSWLPILLALTLALLCITLLTRTYLIALLVALVAGVLVLRWSWENGAQSGGRDSVASPGEAKPNKPARPGVRMQAAITKVTTAVMIQNGRCPRCSRVVSTGRSLARIRTSKRLSIAILHPPPARLPTTGSCRARNSHTTTSPMPMLPGSASRPSKRRPA